MGKLIPAESECKSTFLGGETYAEEPGALSTGNTMDDGKERTPFFGEAKVAQMPSIIW